MLFEGQIVVFAFPQTDSPSRKTRPALLLRRLPGRFDDWLLCMISSQLAHELPGVDEIVRDSDPDFAQTGLKTTSLIRITRLAAIQRSVLQGSIGSLAQERLEHIRARLAAWING